MTKARRLLVVLGGIALTAMISTSHLWGDGPGQIKQKLPANDKAGGWNAETDWQANQSELAKKPVLSYEPLKGDPLFSLQLQPDLPNVPRRPRDLLLMVSITASQAGAPLNSSKQIVESLLSKAAPEDRVAIWVVSTKDEKFTRSLTGDFIPANDKKAIAKALADLKKEYPAGNADLKNGLQKAIASFTSANRHRVMVFLGDGMSLHQPLTVADRQELTKQMVQKKITFFPIPLGNKIDSANIHGLASTTGGKVVRVKIFEEKVDDALNRLENAFVSPVLYPTNFQLGTGVVEHYPTQLPPLRKDTPTLLVGRFKDTKEIKCNLEGTVDGVAAPISRTITQTIPAHDNNNFFLVSILRQWKQAPTSASLIQADRALVLAYEQNHATYQGILKSAATAMGQKDLNAAQKFYELAAKVNPHDSVGKAGLQVVASLKSGKLTEKMIEEQLAKSVKMEGVKIEKIGGKLKITHGQLLELAKFQPPPPPKGGDPKGGMGGGMKEPDFDFFKAHTDQKIIEEQKVKEGVEEVIQKAKALLQKDPDTAAKMLRQALLQTQDHPDLGQKARDILTSQLKTALRDVTIRGQFVLAQKAQQKKTVEATISKLEQQEIMKAEEAQLAAQFNVYRSLMNQGRLEEKTFRDILAGMLAIRSEAKLKGMDVPVQTEMLYFQAQARFNIEKLRELKFKREQAFLNIMMNVEKTHVPFPDEPPIHYPPLSMWKAITDLRKDKYEVSSLPDDYKARQEAFKIKALLDEPIDMKDFQLKMRLSEAMGLFYEIMAGKKKELPILLDSEAFKAEDPDAPPIYDTMVTFPAFPKKMSIATAMKLALSQVPTKNATYVIRKNHIEITTEKVVSADKVLRVYPVGELVLPISPAGGGLFGLGGGGIGGIGGFGGGFQIGGGIGGFGGGFQIGGGLGGFGGGLGGLGGGLGGFGGGLGGIGGGLGGFGGGFQIGGGLGGFGGGIGGIGGGLGGFQIGGGLGGFGGGFNIGGGLGGFGGGFNIGGGLGGFGGGIGGFQIGGGIGGFQIGGGIGGLAGGGIGGIAGGFNGNLGIAGATQAQPLIDLIVNVVAPGEWGLTPYQQAFQQIQGGFAAQAGFVGIAGNFNAAGFAGINAAGFAGINAAGFAGIGGAGFAGFNAGAGGFQPGGVGGFQGPQLQPLNVDYSKLNTIDFFQPALALVVRAPSQIHFRETGGVIGGKKKDLGIGGPGIPGLPGAFAPKDDGKGQVAGVQDLNDLKNKVKKGTDPKDLDPTKIWDNILAKGADPGMVIATADFLFEHKKFKHATEFLKATLRHGIIVRPWVYEALAVSMEVSGSGSPEELKRLYLSGLSLEPNNALSYLKAAEIMAKHKDYEHALAYCRQSALIEPSWPNAYEQALGYAKQAKDSQAMQWAASQILDQDWPINQKELHLKARQMVGSLIKILQDEGNNKEAAKLQDLLTKTQERDLIIKLHWVDGQSGSADFELLVKEPNGSVCSSQQRLTPGGGTLIGNDLANPTQASYIAARAFSGDYEITIKKLWGEPLGGKVFLEIIRNDGTAKKKYQRLTINIKDKHTKQVTLDEGRRTEVAVVPVVLPQTQAAQKAQEQEGGAVNVLAKLRDLADPFFGGRSAGGFQGGFNSSAVSQGIALNAVPIQKSADLKNGPVVFQSGIASPNNSGVNLTANTSISQDGQVMLQVIPTFNLGNLEEPDINLPMIPGGRSN